MAPSRPWAGTRISCTFFKSKCLRRKASPRRRRTKKAVLREKSSPRHAGSGFPNPLKPSRIVTAGGSLPATSRHRHGGTEPHPLLHERRRHGRVPAHDRLHGYRVVLHLLRPLHCGLSPLLVGCDEVGTAMSGDKIYSRGEERRNKKDSGKKPCDWICERGIKSRKWSGSELDYRRIEGIQDLIEMTQNPANRSPRYRNESNKCEHEQPARSSLLL